MKECAISFLSEDQELTSEWKVMMDEWAETMEENNMDMCIFRHSSYWVMACDVSDDHIIFLVDRDIDQLKYLYADEFLHGGEVDDEDEEISDKDLN